MTQARVCLDPTRLRDLVLRKGIRWFPARNCSICTAELGYEIKDQVYFNYNCDCTSRWSPPQMVGWGSLAEALGVRPQMVEDLGLQDAIVGSGEASC
jgi:hypothetical protein